MVQSIFSIQEKAGQRHSNGSPKNIIAPKIAPRTNHRLSNIAGNLLLPLPFAEALFDRELFDPKAAV